MALVVSSQKPSNALKDSDYFMNSEFIIFQVEGVLFRVPTYAFVSESNVFSTIFKLPQGNKSSAEGTLADNPIKLPENIKIEGFKGLLKLLYPLKPLTNPTPDLTRDEWISTVKLATEWRILSARKVALQALQKTKGSPVDKITLGRALKVSKWVLEGYQDLANINDTTTIVDEVASTIGWETTTKLLQIREEKLRNRNSTSAFNTPSPVSPSPATIPIFNFSFRKAEKTVEDSFKEELLQIRTEELQYSNVFEKPEGQKYLF